jgi:hypothetical protein
MTRSRSQCFCLAIFAILTAGPAGSPSRAGDPPIVLENSHVLLEIGPAFGTLARILDKSSGIALAPPPILAENFRLVLLMPDRKTPTIVGKDQKLSGVSRTSDGLTLSWNGPLKDAAGVEHKITVRMDVKAVDNEIQFGLHLDNGTAGKIKEARYPMIGGLSKFGPPGKLADGVLCPPPDSAPKKIDASFNSEAIAYPGQARLSYSCVQSESAKKSLYFASHDQIGRYKVYHFDKHVKDNTRDVFASIEHCPYTPLGRSFDGSTVVLQVVDGDWHGAAAVYRAWFEKTFGVCKPSQSWLRRESFFVFTMFELPEGTITLKFKDIPRWAKESKDYGINSMHISGWQVGGHDNGYPDYSPSPRLGTWKELEDGIKACHALGQKAYFFVNYQQVMIDSNWYKKELHKYHEWRDENGSVTWNTGWPMGTLWGRMGHPKRMVGADPAFPEYRKIIVDQFVKLAQIGADGIHVDKMFPAFCSGLDFNPNLPMSPDVGPWEGVIILTKEIFTECRKYNPNWAMSFECNWDRMMQFTCSTWWGGVFNHAVFPDSVGMASITSPFDYLGVNNLVCGRCTVLVGPMNFCRSMGWKPWEGLANYIKEVKGIQDRLTNAVWLGEAVGPEEVRLGSGIAGVSYHVFRDRTTGKRVCILSNHSKDMKISPFQAFQKSSSSQVRIHTPFQQVKTASLPAKIEVAGERIVFVEEL